MSIYTKKAMELCGSKIKNILSIPGDVIHFVYGLYELLRKNRKDFPIIGIIPIIGDDHISAGGMDRHYFLQDIYMAKKIRISNPERHYDIGSRTDGFISHLLCDDIPVTMIDIRPLPHKVEGLSFVQGDATDLKQFKSESIDSLSSLHAVEHFGLSRYGDKLDMDACNKVMLAMQRVLKIGGMLYFSVPISYRNGILYNSHRVFKPEYILRKFDKLRLLSFAYIHDYKVCEYYEEEAEKVIHENRFDEYDCGMFIFRKE